MKTQKTLLLISALVGLAGLAALGQTLKISQQPVATTVSTNDDVLINATNSGAGTWTTKRATVARMATAVQTLILPQVTNAASGLIAAAINALPTVMTNVASGFHSLALAGLGSNSLAPFRVIIVPDTQNQTTNEFREQMRWIETNRLSGYPIAAMLHIGDLQNNSGAAEWGRVAPGLALLTNTPFLLAPGNHDYDLNQLVARTLTTWNAYVPTNRYTTNGWWSGGFYEGDTGNSWLALNAGALKLLLFAVEFGPRTNVLNWVSNVCAANPEHLALVATHNFLLPNGELETAANTNNPGTSNYDPAAYYGMTNATSGAESWAMLGQIPNLHFIVCGHQMPDPAEAHAILYGTNGNWVSSLMVNYQNHTSDLALKELTFFPARGEVLARTFSVGTYSYLADSTRYTLPMSGNGPIGGGTSQTLSYAPSIVSQPQSQGVYFGSNATFSVYAVGMPPFAYQWRFSGTNLAAATTTAYTVTNAQASNGGSYTVVVTNYSGAVTSAAAVLTLTTNMPGAMPLAWYEASDLATNGSTLVWPDKWVNGFDLTNMGSQTTWPYEVLAGYNGHSSLRFSAAQYLKSVNYTSPAPFELVMLLKLTNSVAQAVLWDSVDYNYRQIGVFQDRGNGVQSIGCAALALNQTNWTYTDPVTNRYFVLDFVCGNPSGTGYLYTNNVQAATGTPDTNAVSGFTLAGKWDLAANRYPNMDVVEIATFSGTLPGANASTRSNVFWYFTNKYNFTP
jgi:hypothetical protein